jgi:glycosidase
MKTFSKFFIFYLFFNTISYSQVTTPKWAYDAVIYEVNIRQYTPEGTFNAFAKYLPKLKDLGVDIIWLMPINPIGEKNRKGTLGSYYSVKNYEEINPEFGTKADFRSLVNKIHQEGMYVIIDWVANHTSWDNVWVKEHPDFYTRDSLGNYVPPVPDWTDAIDLNYKNKLLWQKMIDALKYWVEEFNIDGFRCDVAGMVPTEFWNEARAELDKIKPVFLLAEWETPEMHKKAFNMTYAWEINRMETAIYKGKKNAKDIKNQIIKDLRDYPKNAFRMQFTSNHDENSWEGTEFERLGDATKMFAVFSTVIPGMPLVYNGQEAGFNRRLSFFEKDSIDWKKSSYFDLYKKLFELKKNNQALWNGKEGGSIRFLKSNDDQNILAFVRQKEEDKIISVFNMSPSEKKVVIDSNALNGNYVDFDSEENVKLKDKFNLDLNPWSYKVLYTKP